GLCRPPFLPAAEKQIEIALPEHDELIRGRIDVLIVHQQLWVTVIESKQKGFNVLEALPQALAYMMNSPNTDTPLFGLATNGAEFLFLKLLKQPSPRYALSEPLSLLNYENDLYRVLGILRRLATLVIQADAA
ncbi:MAG: restriction endonuclease subunit R, partial [Cyanothece sp. SIO1E1]|nr:restriction endonuclease subunit R [Cyanothece sp. SIO1E1]